jgi:hypothetical protein
MRLCGILESVEMSAFGALDGVDVVVEKSPDDVFVIVVDQPIGSLGTTTVSNLSTNGGERTCASRSEKLNVDKNAAEHNTLEIMRPPLMIARW